MALKSCAILVPFFPIFVKMYTVRFVGRALLRDKTHVKDKKPESQKCFIFRSREFSQKLERKILRSNNKCFVSRFMENQARFL